MILPSLSDFLKISKKGNIVAIVKELPSDLITPVDAYYATSATYLLESVEKGSVIGRYSFLGIDPIIRFEVYGDTITITENGSVKKMTLNDPIRKVGEILKRKPYIGEGDLSPFPGGAVGFIGYEYVRHWEKIGKNSEKPGLNVPDSVFLITQYNLVFDNLKHTLKIIANVHTSENLRSDYNKAIQGIQEIENNLEQKDRSIPKISQLPEPERITSSYTRDKFMEVVEKAKSLITEGEAIQIVLSQQMTAEYSGDPFLIFRALRTINPSPYMFYLDFGDFVILGASPEVMVKVDEKKALLRPIAGTRPRGKTPQEDQKFKDDLLSDEKELAEHIMLVDLARNDLGRIAKLGTVTPTRMMEVEMYSHVMHIVSEVTAELGETMDVFDVIKATFPAGTVSGAPKVRAMEIIDEFEPVKRGPYAGLIGYLSYQGTLDSCITIRSMVINNKKLYLQAGAGIVYDSVPEKEYEETMNKARALLKALSAGGLK